MIDFKIIASGNKAPIISEVKGKDSDAISLLPDEIILKIFFYLGAMDLGRSLQVDKQWHRIASDESLWRALPPPEIAFGKKAWAKYFGNVGEEPPLPLDIYKILKSPCPIWSNKTVEETHKLVLIPGRINGNALTINELKKIIKPFDPAEMSRFWLAFLAKYGDRPAPDSRWGLITTGVLPGSKGLRYADQKKLVAKITEETGIVYKVPSALDVGVTMCMQYVVDEQPMFTDYLMSSRENLFGEVTLTFTSCHESINGGRAIVGGINFLGLRILNRSSLLLDDYVGVAAMRIL